MHRTLKAVCAGEYVGLEEIDNGIWNVYFGPLKLGRLLEEHMWIEDANGKLKGPVDLWITSLLPTGSTGLRCGMWTTSLLPTYPQPCKLSQSTKEPQGGTGIDIKV
jgi:hypothetical protein